MVQAKRQPLISAKENTLVSIANFCKQTINVETGYSDRLGAMFSGPLPMQSLISFLSEGLQFSTHSVGSVTFSRIPCC